jgi:glutamate N-acetyltransferase/amino-acid N-acetyltransferase
MVDFLMADMFRSIPGGVTAPRGFRAGSTYSGIKSDATTRDLALLIADQPCVAAATFTTSRTPAAPVLVDKDHLAASANRAQAVFMNSGNANCSTGERGMRDARRMADLVAEHYHIPANLVQVSSTGIIGRFLPMENIETGIGQIAPTADGGEDFAGAIITTDTRMKTISIEFAVGGQTARMGGCTKGAGMIYPNMATMLCYITTDAAVEQTWLQDILRQAVNDSFNMICVDGDMSTNDTVLVMASGLAGNTAIAGGSPDAQTFAAALNHVTRYLAKEIARDGEGATKLMEVTARGAATDADARRAARSVTLSPLWQCALAGEDPNWGRILAALGASGAEFDHNQLDISLGSAQVVKGGLQTEYQRADAAAQLLGNEVTITVDLHAGDHSATAWGCDLTHGYIDENTLYSR